MGSIADLYVAVRAQMDTFEKEVVKGAETAGAKAGDAAGETMGRGLAAKLKGKFLTKNMFNDVAMGLGLGGPLGLAVGGISKVISVLSDAGRAASDLSETESKLTQVFPGQAKAIRDWAQGSAKNMGLSTKAAEEAAGTFGNFLQAMGTGPQVAADMSQSVVQLASDLGSFNNQNPEEVLGALQSGLAGETEPLRRFGVDISDAAVQTQLLASGVQKVGKGFTQGQKIQGRYQLIMKQTIKAQGDYARTATGTANATRTTAAEQENLSAKVGETVNNMQNLVTTAVGTGAGAVVGALDAVGHAWQQLQAVIDPGNEAIQQATTVLAELAKGEGFDPATAQKVIDKEAEATKAQTDRLNIIKQTTDAYMANSVVGREKNHDDEVAIAIAVEQALVAAGLEEDTYKLAQAQQKSAEATQLATNQFLQFKKITELAAATGMKDVVEMTDEIAARMDKLGIGWDEAVNQIFSEVHDPAGNRFVKIAERGAKDFTAAYTKDIKAVMPLLNAVGDDAGKELGNGLVKAVIDPLTGLPKAIAARIPLDIAAVADDIVATWETIPGKVHKVNGKIKHEADTVRISFNNSLKDARNDVKLRMAEIEKALTHPFHQKHLLKIWKQGMEDAEAAKAKAQKAGNVEAYALADAEYEYLKGKVDALNGLTATVSVVWDIANLNAAIQRAGGRGQFDVHTTPPKKHKSSHTGHGDSGTSEGSGDAPTYGAMGKRYVPYDGFLMSLHRGERVLTASQARYDDNTGGGMSGRIDFVVHDPDGGLARSGISAMGLASLLGSQQQLQRRWEG